MKKTLRIDENTKLKKEEEKSKATKTTSVYIPLIRTSASPPLSEALSSVNHYTLASGEQRQNPQLQYTHFRLITLVL